MDISNNYKYQKPWNYLAAQKLIAKTKNGGNRPRLEVVEVASIQCNLLDKENQQRSEVLYTFTYKTSYVYLLNV